MTDPELSVAAELGVVGLGADEPVSTGAVLPVATLDPLTVEESDATPDPLTVEDPCDTAGVVSVGARDPDAVLDVLAIVRLGAGPSRVPAFRVAASLVAGFRSTDRRAADVRPALVVRFTAAFDFAL